MPIINKRLATDATAQRIATALEYFADRNPNPILIEKTIIHNGTYNASSDNADGYSSVTVNVSEGSGVPILTSTQWNTMTRQQKHEYGLVAIQYADTGYDRGELVNGSDYTDRIVQWGTAASSATISVSVTGAYKLIVIALNNEASTYNLTISATLNNTALTGQTLSYNSYYASGNNRRNYRFNVYDIEVENGDAIGISLTNVSNYTAIVYAIVDSDISEVLQARTTADDPCSGSYSSDAIVLQGTFSGSPTKFGTISMDNYRANATILTDDPGDYYRSAYIFWCGYNS